MTDYDPIEDARAERAADLERLAQLDDPQTRYLANLAVVDDDYDPNENLECDTDEREGL